MRPMKGGSRVASVLALALLVASAGCGSRTAPPPEPGTSQGVPPDLRGRKVMVYPVQQLAGVPAQVDDELMFAFRSRASEVQWVPPADLDRALERSPSLQSRTRGLPVGQFLRTEVVRVGDPLFGDLYRLAALVGGEAALIPVRAELVRNPEETDPRIRLTMTLIDPRSGYVAWFGVMEGDAHPVDDPRLLASAADLASRTILWYAQR